jgi:hypothetical protein
LPHFLPNDQSDLPETKAAGSLKKLAKFEIWGYDCGNSYSSG